MIDNKEIIKVTNRSFGTVGYNISDLNIRRTFAPQESKELTAEELRKLSYINGGKRLLDRYLVINNQELVEELLGDVEPEYYYTQEEVKYLLTQGTYDQLADCLDFASQGVISLVTHMAVELEINDVSKRDLILKKTGFNVNSAIEFNHATAEEAGTTAHATRRAAPVTAKTIPVVKVAETKTRAAAPVTANTTTTK